MSVASWKEALQTAPKAPKELELLKVLVFKPKTAKNATPVPVVVVARDGTETKSSLLGKKLNLQSEGASSCLRGSAIRLSIKTRVCPLSFTSVLV
jgi:hypothetical protein